MTRRRLTPGVGKAAGERRAERHGLLNRAAVLMGAACLVAVVSACGSSEATRTQTSSARRSPGSNVTLQTGYSGVAVARDRAVIADGSVPTQFSIVALTSDGAGEPRRIDPAPPLLIRALVPLDEKILIAGNSCTAVQSGVSLDEACGRSRAVMGLLDPADDGWIDLSLGDESLSIANVFAVATPDHHASVYVTVRHASKATKLDGTLFDLDLSRGVLSPRPLPSGFVGDTNQSEGAVCLASDGSATAVTSSLSDSSTVSEPTRAWSRGSESRWSSIPLPSAVGPVSFADGCVGGQALIAGPNGERFTLVAEAGWLPFPSRSALFDGSDPGVPVVGAADPQRWAGGRVWKYSPEGNTFIETGIPAGRVEGSVRASAAWGSDRVVALVDQSTELVDESSPSKSVVKIFSTN